MIGKAYLSNMYFSYEECTCNLMYIENTLHCYTVHQRVITRKSQFTFIKQVHDYAKITIVIIKHLNFRYFNYRLWWEVSGKVMSNARNL